MQEGQELSAAISDELVKGEPSSFHILRGFVHLVGKIPVDRQEMASGIMEAGKASPKLLGIFTNFEGDPTLHLEASLNRMKNEELIIKDKQRNNWIIKPNNRTEVEKFLNTYFTPKGIDQLKAGAKKAEEFWYPK